MWPVRGFCLGQSAKESDEMVTFVPAVDLQAIEVDEVQQDKSQEEDQGPV
jgi:hypothetical protein